MRTLTLLTLLLGLSACTQVDSLIADAARQVPSALPVGAGGTWDTTYGEMTFSRLQDGRVTATYKGEDGHLDGTMSNRVYVGYWTEPSSARNCGTTRNGTPYWGRFEYVFNPQMNAFTGGWDYCDAQPNRNGGSWTGTRN